MIMTSLRPEYRRAVKALKKLARMERWPAPKLASALQRAHQLHEEKKAAR